MAGKKGGTIRIDLEEDDEKIILKVEDKGYGIPDSILSKIFEPLFTTKPYGRGTGLGLSIIHEIVYSEFRGIISVKSVEKEGTVFTIKFNKQE